MTPKRYSRIKPIAFYLPQFHPVPENDEWWGNGFTEWRSCVTARPLFREHYQPKLPGDLGFYDLRMPEVQQEQARLARAHGIRGFCHYFYWFDGRRILERPTELLLANKNIDIEFCLCWANENWSRRWDGKDREVLLQQRYAPSTFPALATELLRYFEDDRYIKVHGRPVFIIYQPAHVQQIGRLIETLRRAAEKRGFPGLHIIGAETFVEYGAWKDPRGFGLDAAVEFPPHGTASDLVNPVCAMGKKFHGNLFDQLSTYISSVVRPDPEYPLYRCLFPAWDNTPRRGTHGSIYLGASPDLFAHWLDYHCQWTERIHDEEEQLLFINAWNEWAEGAYLEPDILYGSSYLEALSRVLDGEFKLECPVSTDEIAELDPQERSRFAAEYLRHARPVLGYKTQNGRSPEHKFQIPLRLYQPDRRERFLMSVFGHELSSRLLALILTLFKPRTFGQLRHEITMLLRVDHPITLGEWARNLAYLTLRGFYRALKTPLRIVRWIS
jgi:hypothetical protein